MKSRRRGLVRGMGRNLAAAMLAAALIGAALPLAADEGEIVWGASIPLTGIYAQAGELASLGMDAYLGYLNAGGGINGRPVRLASHDSGSQPDRSLAIFKRIMAEEEDVVVYYGDSTDFSLLSAPEVNERYKVLMGGASLATALADPEKFPYQFLAGPTYAEMVGILLEYIAEQGGSDGAAPRVALFYSNLEAGHDPIPYARKRAAELGIEIVAEIETEPAGIDVAPEVLKLRRAQPDYVIFQGYVATVWPEVMVQAAQTGVDAMFMGTFWAMEPLIIRQLGPLADRYMGVFPYRYYWEQEESATMRLIAQVTGAEYVPTYALQAWFSGMIITEVIGRTLAAGLELTGDNLKATLDAIEDWDTGGLIGVPVTFRNNSIPVGRIYRGNSETGRMDPVSDWIVLDD
ncbi:MAG: ABC transporter substrate-binding protein [Spirochaetaceae bacterium]|nr:ABC transporter substrate-binding protein [Spirochaetaceae bacterium]